MKDRSGYLLHFFKRKARIVALLRVRRFIVPPSSIRKHAVSVLSPRWSRQKSYEKGKQEAIAFAVERADQLTTAECGVT